MVTIDEKMLRTYISNLRYNSIKPSNIQKKMGIIRIFEDLEIKKLQNTTYQYIVVYKDAEGKYFQDFVDTNDKGIIDFLPLDFPDTWKSIGTDKLHL